MALTYTRHQATCGVRCGTPFIHFREFGFGLMNRNHWAFS
ncbi:Uncharacterised protein [Vibrio cholerae]|nr:Uncharacterised protein [Vibrio cholerae]